MPSQQKKVELINTSLLYFDLMHCDLNNILNNHQ